MEKEKITITIGSGKALVFEADPANKYDQDFAKLCSQVGESQPQSLQEFFTRLIDLQKKTAPEIHKKNGRRL